MKHSNVFSSPVIFWYEGGMIWMAESLVLQIIRDEGLRFSFRFIISSRVLSS